MNLVAHLKKQLLEGAATVFSPQGKRPSRPDDPKTVGLSAGLLTLKHLAGLRQRAGDYAGALRYLDEGLKTLAVEPAPGFGPWETSPPSADFLALKAHVLLKSDPQSVTTKKTAHQLLVVAGEITDRVCDEQRVSPEAKADLIGALQVVQSQLRLVLCEALAQAEPGGGWGAAAFRAAEESRARVFLEQLGRNRSGVIGDLPTALAERERQSAQELTRLQHTLEAIEAAPFDKRDPARVAALQKGVSDATREAEDVQAVIARDYPRVAALRRPHPCSVAEARAVLGKNEAAVVYCCGEEVSTAIVLQPMGAAGGIGIVPLAGTASFEEDFEVLIDEGNLKVPDLYRGKAVKLYDALIKPLEKVVGDRDLLIVPDGKLGLLPFEALIDAKGRFLIETRAVRMAPSLTALHLNGLWEQKRPRPARVALAVGDPVTAPTARATRAGRGLLPSARRLSERTGERFDRLVHSGREATAVADVLKAPAEDRWLGLDAAEGRLKSWNASGRLADYRYLHFATHGVLGAGHDVPPALVLSLVPGQPPDTEDGLLGVREVSELRLNADLVVLSACRSARGELRTGEGVTGLARGFLSAGARGVVCSLWAVDDRDTAALMVEVYEQVGRGIPVAAALRTAKLRLIREGKRPYDWAPFALIGASN